MFSIRLGNFIWTGAADNNWNNSANRDRNLVPDACDVRVEIPAATLRPIITSPVTVGKLQMDSGSALKVTAAFTIRKGR